MQPDNTHIKAARQAIVNSAEFKRQQAEIKHSQTMHVAKLAPQDREQWIKTWGARDPEQFSAMVETAKLRSHALVAISNAPEFKRTEPFLFHWQCAIEVVGAHAVTPAASVKDGNYWNATNHYELPMNLAALDKKMNYTQRHIAGLMACLYDPLSGWRYHKRFGLIFHRNYQLDRDTRVLLLNLLASFSKPF